MDTKVIVYQTNDVNELDSIIASLKANNIDLLVVKNGPDPVFGQNNTLFIYEIFVPVNHQDKAFDLINTIVKNNEFYKPIEKQVKKYEDLNDYYNFIFDKFDTKSTYGNMTWNWAAFFFKSGPISS